MNQSQYNRILAKSRKKELILTRGKLRNVISLLDETSDLLENEIARFSDEYGKIRKDQLKEMKARVDRDLDNFKEQYDYIVKSGIGEMSAVILERNGEIFIQVEGTKKIIDLLQDQILMQVLTLKEKDGLILSDRIWRLTEESKADIINRLQKGILLGESHTNIAKDIRQYIKGGGLKYKSERLAFTEMAKAYKRANEMSVEIMRQNSQFMWFEKWELSPRHPAPDLCLKKGTIV